MFKWYYKAKAQITGKFSPETPVNVILEQMNTPMALPTGRQEFEDWSDRIISGANLVADRTSQKFMLASSLLQLGPTESHKEDAYFIHVLRVSAMRQVADARFREIRDEQKAAWEAKEAERKQLELEAQGEYPHDQTEEIKVVKSTL